MKLSGWGQFPEYDSKVIRPELITDLIRQITSDNCSEQIARGLGRSYGDSSLANTVINSENFDSFIQFDDETGRLDCYAGVSLEDILSVFIPRGWFLNVTPGTKFVTVGGAIASDVHGKNHHRDGCFSEYLFSIKLLTVSEGVVECSRAVNSELFYATCGGMGLTGFILEASFRLKKIESSYVNEYVHKCDNLEQTIDVFKQNTNSNYSVAWIDCLKRGKNLGRSIVSLGDHSTKGGLFVDSKSKLNIPFNMPSSLLNSYSIQLFNYLHYARLTKEITQKSVSYDSFFYPLDKVTNWNRIYGKKGFIQYQLVLPDESSNCGLKTVLSKIAESRLGSFLAVLKSLGKQNENLLSFPVQGLTLALDFKMTKGLLTFLNELDSIVVDFGGRVYLTKDSRMSEETFKKCYPQWLEFLNIRKKYAADQVFNSLQSRRLGL